MTKKIKTKKEFIKINFFLDKYLFYIYNNICHLYGDVAQLARANGSYPLGQRFESTHRYHPKANHCGLLFFVQKKKL